MKKITSRNTEVVAPFIDRESGKTVKPGDPVPKRLLKDQEAAQRLVKARCLKITGQAPKSPPKPKPPETPPSGQQNLPGSETPGNAGDPGAQDNQD